MSIQGKTIYDFLIKNDINNVLEIGTWNGLGSTKLLYEALSYKNQNFFITSLETDKIAYKNAKKNLRNLRNLKLLYGRIIEIDELPDPKSIDFKKHKLNPENIEWFYQDIRRYRKTKNILKSLENSYDFILFDGGEFSTYAEFIKLYNRTKFFCLDDINTYKQYGVLKFINSNQNLFELIETVEDISIYKVN